MSEREGGKREGGGQRETREVGTDSSTETEMLEAAHSTSGVPSRALVAGASVSTAGPLLHYKAFTTTNCKRLRQAAMDLSGGSFPLRGFNCLVIQS